MADKLHELGGELESAVGDLERLPSRWHIPIFEGTTHTGESPPSQSRDLGEPQDLRTPSSPQGPPLADVGDRLGGVDDADPMTVARVLAAIVAEEKKAKRRFTEFAQVTGNTDTSGNLDLELYVVPAGYECSIARVNVEDPTHTPASPFTNAAAWIALIRGVKFGAGSILDFGPAASNGPMIPCIFSTSVNHAPKLRGGEILTLHVVGSASLANTAIFARAQLELVEL